MPGECGMLIGLDLGDRPAQKRPDNRSSHHALHALVGHEPEEETKQKRRRDIEVPPADLPLVIESPRNVGLGFHWASSDWLRAGIALRHRQDCPHDCARDDETHGREDRQAEIKQHGAKVAEPREAHQRDDETDKSDESFDARG